MPPRRSPMLLDELLHFPPDDPASLVRAVLVSKPWCRLIAGRGFRRRYREIHRAAPMLGFICNVLPTTVYEDYGMRRHSDAWLVPTTSCLPRADHRDWRALDSRHGRVLLCRDFCLFSDNFTINVKVPLVVWNPNTGEHLELPSLTLEQWCTQVAYSCNATVLCTGGDACDHLGDDCQLGHFLVVFVALCLDGVFTFVYSSESGAWSEPSVTEETNYTLDLVPAALVGNALYFVIRYSMRILKYDLGTRENSIIDLPHGFFGRIILMTTAQGKLGFTRADDDFKLYLWSMEVSAQGAVKWTQDMVIELKNLLPANALLTPGAVVGCVHGRGVILFSTGEGFFTVDPKLNQAIK